MKMIKHLFILTLLLSMFFDTKGQVSNAVVEVYAGSSVVGIGFVWPDQYHIVTPLHVIAGRKNFKVRSYTPGSKGIYIVDKVDKILKKADLALLELETPINVKPVTVANEVPSITRRYSMYRTSPGGTLIAGFDKKMETGVHDLSFYFNTGNPKMYNALLKQGYPQTSAKIARVKDPVMPGDSGSPICNSQGAVVGIIDGGFYKGLRSYNWAIMSSHLYELDAQANGHTFADVSKTNAALSLVTDNVEATRPLNFYNNKVSLQNIFTSTLGQINATQDLDQYELADIEEDYADIARKTGKYIKNAKIDVYQDWNTGATIAIPQGFILEYSESHNEFLFLQAVSPSGRVKMVFAVIDETFDDPGQDFIDYILDLDYNADWQKDQSDYDEEDDYASYDYYFINNNGGDAAISLLYLYEHFLGLGAYIVSEETTSEDEYYFELLKECVILSDFPEY